MPLFPATVPKTYWEKLEFKTKCRKRTTFAVVLESHICRDDGRGLGHWNF